MDRRRKGMALVAVITIVSLIAILAVATLSLSGRTGQIGELAVRDARLDAAAGFGVGSVLMEWRSRALGQLGVGSTSEFAIPVPEIPVSTTVALTRLSPEVFWVVATARSLDGSVRRENLVLRLRVPNADSLLAADSSNVVTVGRIGIDSIAATADLRLERGVVWSAMSGVVHAAGDLIIDGGIASGILIVEGKLTIAGPLRYAGLIVARGGIQITTQSARVSGAIRMIGQPVSLGDLDWDRSALTLQTVLSNSLTPSPVAGRRWAEMY